MIYFALMERQHMEVKKRLYNGGMKNRVGYINEKKLKRAIKLMKENRQQMRVV